MTISPSQEQKAFIEIDGASYAKFGARVKAVLQSGDFSDPGLGEITGDMIDANAADYTAWYLRRRFLETNEAALDLAEVGTTHVWIKDSPKSYQAWHHLRWLMDHIPKTKEAVSEELKFVSMQLDTDGKNVNAWQFRQWLVKQFELYKQQQQLDAEYIFAETQIMVDCRNNSAWNYRRWLCDFTDKVLWASVRKREVRYCLGWLKRFPENECCWNYLNSWYADETDDSQLPHIAEIVTPAREVIAALVKPTNGVEPSKFALETQIRLLVADGNLIEASKMLAQLKRIAPLHMGYYDWRWRKVTGG